jgi:hypothetical protein
VCQHFCVGTILSLLSVTTSRRECSRSPGICCAFLLIQRRFSTRCNQTHTSTTPYSWSARGNSKAGFAQQRSLFGSVQICVFGDGVQGKGCPSPAAAIEKSAKVTDAHETFGQHVQKETTQELRRCQRHLTMSASAGIILPTESHALLIEGQQAVIGNGYAMGLAT